MTKIALAESQETPIKETQPEEIAKASATEETPKPLIITEPTTENTSQPSAAEEIPKQVNKESAAPETAKSGKRVSPSEQITSDNVPLKTMMKRRIKVEKI